MGFWTKSTQHLSWEDWHPDTLGEEPDVPGLEVCACWDRGCILTRHLVTVGEHNGEALRDYRYEIFHHRPAPLSRPPPDRERRRDGKRLASGEDL